MKRNFVGYRIFGCQSFCFTALNTSHSSMVSDEKSAVDLGKILCDESLLSFKIILFFTGFWQFGYDVCWISVYPTWNSLSLLHVLVFKYSIYLFPLLLSIMCMLVFLMVFFRSEARFIFLHSLVFLFLRLGNLNRPIFKLVDCFFWLLISAVSSLYWIFHFSYYFSQICNFCLVFYKDNFLLIFSLWWDIILIISFISLDMVSFSCFNILKITDLKSLYSKFNVGLP